MALSIVDLIPSLGRYVARNRAGAEQAGLDQSAAAVQALMGSAPGQSLQPGQFNSGGMENMLQTPGSGLMQDPTSAANQLKFSQGLMGVAGYGKAGQQFMNTAMGQQLGLPMEQARLAEVQRNNLFGNILDYDKHQQGTTLNQNISSMLNHPDPATRQAFKDYLEKTDSTTITLPSSSDRSQAAFLAESIQANETVNTQLNSGYVPGIWDENMWQIAPQGLRNHLISDEYQSYITNSSAWVQANLRPVSGAVLGEQEVYDNFITHFPQSGDSDKVIEEKRLLRAQKEQSALSRAGEAGDTVKVITSENTPPATVSGAQGGGSTSTKVTKLPSDAVDANPLSTREISERRAAQIDAAGAR